MINSNPHFPALTGLRAIAAWLVFIHHFPGPFSNSEIGIAFATEAHIGVSIFFTLSGFLITYRYSFKDGAINLKTYFLNRFAKIYPLYFLLTSLSFLRLKLGDWNLYLYNITLTKGLFNELKFSGIAQGWTLTVEELFYLIAPLIILSISKRKFLIVLWPLSFFMMGFGYTLLPHFFHPNGFLSTPAFIIQYTIFGRLLEFILGVALSILWKEGVHFKSNILPKPTYFGLILFVIVYALICSFQSKQFEFGQEHPIGALLHNVLLPITTAIILFGLISEKTLISKFLSSKLMWWLGSASYAFYLIHMGILHDAVVTFITWNWWARFLILNALAIILFLIVEYPCQQFIRNYDSNVSILRNIIKSIKHTINFIR